MKKSHYMWELEQLASSQWGMFTAAQAHVLGVGRTQLSRMLANGTTELMRRGVYRFTVGEETSHAYVKAAWLSIYPKATAAERMRNRPLDAVAAGVTAAALHGIGDFHEEPYTFIVQRRRQTSMDDLVFHQRKLDERDVTFVDTIPTTTMERTVADLVREWHDPEHLRRATEDAIGKGANASRLRELLGRLGPSHASVAGQLAEYADLSVLRRASDIVRFICEQDNRALSDLDPDTIARGEAFVEALLADYARRSFDSHSPE